MKAVVGRFVTAIDERIMTVDLLYASVRFTERSEMRVVLPKFRAGGADVREKSSRMTAMQIAHGGRQHNEIAWRQKIPEDQLAFHGKNPAKGESLGRSGLSGALHPRVSGFRCRTGNENRASLPARLAP